MRKLKYIHRPPWANSGRFGLGRCCCENVPWMGLSPNNKVSGERVLSSRTRKVNLAALNNPVL